MKKYPRYGVGPDGTDDRARTPVEAATVRLATPTAKEMRKKKERQRVVILGAGFFLALIIGLLTAMTTEYPASVVSRISSKTTAITLGPEPYSGRIVLETIGRTHCQRTTFDNRTGRVTETNETNRPCEELNNSVADDKGAPKPTGTNSRVDAISKSFLNR